MIQNEISFNNPLMKYISKTHIVKNNPMGLPISEDDAAFMSDCYCELIYKQYKEELFKI